MAITLNRLGLALEGQSRFPEAESTFLQALAIREALYGPNSRSLLTALNNLTRVYTEEGKEREASRHSSPSRGNLREPQSRQLTLHGTCAPSVPTYTAYNDWLAAMNNRFFFAPPKQIFAHVSGK